ncbi:SDR family oxidoreductase [Acinetobacter venetianus]
MENKHSNQQQTQIAFVAGATGFIGRFLIAELLQQGHQVFALLRQKLKQQAELETWLIQRKVSLEKLTCIQGDVTQPDLAISKSDWLKLSTVNTLYNGSALFAWNLSMQQARAVNVEGAVNLLRCMQQHCQLRRVVHVSGFMLTLEQHLQQIGIDSVSPEQSNWEQIYARQGAYEASKIEAHYAWISQAKQLDLDWTIIHPATVVGDASTGEIPANQPMAHMVDLLKRKKMSAIPATPQHYLPLVTVDYLVRVISHAAVEPSLAQRELLVAHQQRFVLPEMLNIIAAQVQQKAPTQFVPLSVLRVILRWKWLAQKLEMSAEMLDFIRTEPLNTSQLTQLTQKWDIQETDLRKALEKTSLWVYQQP